MKYQVWYTCPTYRRTTCSQPVSFAMAIEHSVWLLTQGIDSEVKKA
jgi:hypothetical protein